MLEEPNILQHFFWSQHLRLQEPSQLNPMLQHHLLIMPLRRRPEAFLLKSSESSCKSSSIWSQATSGHVLHNSPRPANAASRLCRIWWRSSNARVLSVAEGKVGATIFKHSLAARLTDASLSSSNTERWSNNSFGLILQPKGVQTILQPNFRIIIHQTIK